ncbi:unnamed protein product [Rotaria sordida]|uniref:HAT C-terminal dimerisation domain-containing protein n=1 Tax=Rotaria sordida TaxID=392033 RepID=A0A819PDS2_9BILA|nr:unnamed protein product [Rotaria sordida]CAF4012345.1 unnamed protein product [Rotaria sordida]
MILFLVRYRTNFFFSDNDINLATAEDNTSGNENFAYKSLSPDELTRYLTMDINESTLSSNPLDFWKEYQALYPILSTLTRQIHCIPAYSATVERYSPSIGYTMNERGTNLHPDQIDNIVVRHSMENLKKKRDF